MTKPANRSPTSCTCAPTSASHAASRIALEPYNRDDANLLNTVSEATEFIKDVDRSHAKLMADFFHMKLNGESFDALKEAGPHLIHAHIAEPGRGRPQTTPADHALFLTPCAYPATTDA